MTVYSKYIITETFEYPRHATFLKINLELHTENYNLELNPPRHHK